MKLTKVIPKIFYSDISTGVKLFVDCLGFKIAYQENDPNPFYVIRRDDATILLVEDDEFAKKDRPELRIETDDIESLYHELAANPVALFHPNLSRIKTQPWGLKEFALLDESHVCVIIQQPIDNE